MLDGTDEDPEAPACEVLDNIGHVIARIVFNGRTFGVAANGETGRSFVPYETRSG